MYGFRVLLALSILFQLVSGNGFFILEADEEDSFCFDVIVDPENPATLDIHIEEYVPLKQFEQDPVEMAVLVYRRKDVDETSFLGTGADAFQYCGKKAVTKGLCEEKHLGKLIFYYKKDTIPTTKARGEALNRTGNYDDFYKFTEKGKYCLAARSMKTRKWKIIGEVRYANDTSPAEKTQMQIYCVIQFVDWMTAVAYAYMWYKWRSSGSEKRSIPFVSRILILYMVLNAISSTMETLDLITDRTRGPTEGDNFAPIFGVIGQVVLRYYTYIWAAEFNPTSRPNENYQLLAFMLFSALIPYFPYNFYHGGKATKVLYTMSSVNAFITFSTIYAKIFSRYKNRFKEFKSYSKQSSPVFKQCKALIWSRFSFELIMVLFGMCEVAIFKSLQLLYINDDDDLKFPDSSIDLKLIPAASFLSMAIDAYYYFRYFTPEYYESVLSYRERED